MRSSSLKREPEALQQYQRRLNEVLDDASPTPDAVIALEINGQGWLVALNDLAETSVCPRLAIAGAMPPGVMGVGNFRGKVNTVISMPLLMEMKEGEFKGEGWATVLHPRFEVSLALWWPTMMGLFSRSDLVSHTPLHTPSYCRAHWADANGRTWHELDTEQLLRERLSWDSSTGSSA